MPSERVQRRIERLLDEAEQAMDQRDWRLAATLAQDVLDLDPENADAETFLAALQRKEAQATDEAVSRQPSAISSPADAAIGNRQSAAAPVYRPTADARLPIAFVSGRYTVKRFLGEGGKKQVYLAHDELLDRNVAFALIKTDGLDEVGRQRIKREAQAMGRLGSHPHIVSVYDMGEENGQPYIVTELMAGGDVEGLIEKAPEHRPPLERTLEIGIAVCRGLEFAHDHGIVHRDLKPGNVWLSEDGTAKLGDFGLAVAMDRSRLTQAGMMVGTVSYMPPEQAMGGEVSPRSDLYSLGAMLYEMVTGRPPFVGDESVAIITQHLNVAPVAPRWHNPAVPPGLEALILRLLEKDPAGRPASATEVAAMLGSIASPPGPLSSRTGEGEHEGPTPDARHPTPLGDNPMYRRTFVGREAELQQLQHAYDAATSGQGSLVMVVGEPGIGKTTLCEQLTTYAIIRGGKTLVGHCYEEGSLSLPYLPFVEAMRSYVLARDPTGLKQDLGSGAGDVARIVSEIRERLPVEPSAGGADPEEERYRLLQAVTGFLRNAATVQPLVIVLEDLHDADRGTLDLLTHVSRNLAGARLLVIGTYRDIEVDRAHPLSATLAELRRSANFSRVLLRGLTADEVQRMLTLLSGQEVPWPLAEAVHRQTEGNPLFIQEVLRYLVEEGLLKREGGQWRRASGETPLEMGIPEGLRDVIGKRLGRLSPECNRLLAIASVIGRDFTLATLQTVAGQASEEVASRLEAAVRTAVLTEQERTGAVRYRFAHAFFRQTLYEELSAARRIQFHQQVARALEAQYGSRLGEHAAELAEHYSHSSDRADLSKAVHYAELAAERALAVYAYGEAARHLEQALDLQEVLDPEDGAKRCDLLLAFAEALLPAGEPLRVVETVAPEALALAEQIGDHQRASRACQEALAGIYRQRGPTGASTPLFRHWAEQADCHATPGSADRVRADIALSKVAYLSDRLEVAWELIQRALTLARQLDDREALYQAAGHITYPAWLPEHQAERHRLAEELFLHRRAGVSSNTVGFFLSGCCGVFLAWGERERFEEASRQVREIAGRTQDAFLSTAALVHDITLLVLDGRLEEAVAVSETLRQRAEELGVPGFGFQMAFNWTFWPLLHLGRAEQALATMPEDARTAVAERRSMVYGSCVALCLASLGRWTEAQGLLEPLRARLLSAEGRGGLNTFALVHYLAMAILVDDRELVGDLRARLSEAAGLIVSNFLTVIARHLGAASALLGDREAARRYYEQALEVAGRVRFRPEMALTHLQLAELLLDEAVSHQPSAISNEPSAFSHQLSTHHPRPDDEQDRLTADKLIADSVRASALTHLDLAIGELREMKMQPALERALRHKDVLKA